MLEELKERVCKANIQLRDSGLVILTWGNVSAIDREKGLMVIKPSGVPYDELTPDKMVVVNMDGKVVEGDLNPSSDTPTHLILYQAFDEIGAVVHTHSRYATIWAQAGLDIVAYGTTHADYFYGDIPCTMQMTEEQIADDYERNTGIAITDTFQRRRLGCMEMQACLVAQHGPFVWGASPEHAVENAIVLEEIAHMAVFNSQFQFGLTRISEPLLNKHYLRKHGENAYYGQTFGKVTDIVKAPPEETPEENEEMEIKPSNHTVALKNIDQIAEVERPVINKIPKKEESVFSIPENFVGETVNMDIMPSEPDGAGEPLVPNDPEISLTMIAPEQSSIPVQDDYNGKGPATPYSPPKAEYTGEELTLVADKEHEKRNEGYAEPETAAPYTPPVPDFKPEDIGIDLKPIRHKKVEQEAYKEPEIPEPYLPPKPEYKPEEGGVELTPIRQRHYESQFGFNIVADNESAANLMPTKAQEPVPAPVPEPAPVAETAPAPAPAPKTETKQTGLKFSFKNRNKNKPAQAPEPPKPAETSEPPKPIETPGPTKPAEPPKPADDGGAGEEPLDFTF